VKISTSAGIAVLALTMAVQPAEAQQQASAPAVAPVVAPAGVDSVCVPVAVLKKYVGTYDFNFRAGPVTIALKDEHLVRQVAGQPDIVLTPVSETKFKMGNAGMLVEFRTDEKGGVTQVFGAQTRWVQAQRTATP
jgi:hypothetical protein